MFKTQIERKKGLNLLSLLDVETNFRLLNLK